MSREHVARGWFAATAAVAIAGVCIQLVVSWGNDDGGLFDSALGRAVNVLCYFTIQSNLIVAITCGLLALSLDRRSLVFWVARLAGVVAICVTFVVYHLTLAELQELEGGAATADVLLHTASPVMCLAGWLAFGPRGLTSARVAAWTLAFPLTWAVFTLVRGPLVEDFYPYPFLDVPDLGYARVLVNIAVVGVLFVGLALLLTWVDGLLSRRSRSAIPAGASDDG